MSEGDKAERLIDLIGLLLETRKPLTAAEIRAKIPGYRHDNDEAFHRKFERDKTELRDIGFPLEQQDAGWGEPGYAIAKAEALLQDPGLTQDEMAALALAARAWGGSGGDGALGLLKLAIGTGAPEASGAGWVVPRVEVDRTVALLLDACARRKVVRFRYRTAGGGEAEEREVEPHRLSHKGLWYLTGFDRARGEIRHFRLSRVEGSVKVATGRTPDFDEPDRAAATGPRAPWEAEAAEQVRVAFAPEMVWWAERRTGATRVAEREDGWTEVTMPVGDIASFASWLAGFADRALALEPPALREALVQRLRPMAGES